MANQGTASPHILVKNNLRTPTTALDEALLDIRPKLTEIGIYGTEVAISITGDSEADKATLERLLEWAQGWHDAGLAVYVHPYTHGPANPAVCTGAYGGTPHAAFRRVADEVAKIAERWGDKVVLTYHAAEYSGDQGDYLGQDALGGGTLRDALLERSVRFFDLGFQYCEQLDCGLLLVSETQLPPSIGSDRIRIGDRPEEVLRTLGGRTSGACWDSGHYLLSIERVGIAPDPSDEFANVVTHMHIHDVIDSVDHRPLTSASIDVGRYVHRAVSAGALNSITLEYDYRLDKESPGATPSDRILAHLVKAVGLVRGWCDNPGGENLTASPTSA